MDLSKIIISDICEVLTVTANKGKHLNIINRKFYGLSFCTKGKITYTHKGKKYISTPENAVILPIGATYELYNNEAGDFPLINFTCSEKFTDDFLILPITEIEGYVKDFERLKKYFLSSENRLKSISILYDIFARLEKSSAENNDILTPVIKKIHKDFCNSEINNTVLAKEINISEIYLRRLFNERYSTTPKQYIINMRINLAKQLLTETDFLVEEIALKCGFTSVYHFCRAFKNKSGVSPTEYRKKYC